MRRFLALGDSYTIGEGVADGERWPDHLVRLLRERGESIGQPHIIARTAWTADELAEAIDIEGPKGPYDLVSLMVGVNDQYRSRELEVFAPEFAKLVQRARDLAGNVRRVVVISIPDWASTPFAEGQDRAAISSSIEAFNACAKERCGAVGARWVDVTAASREMLVQPALVAVDGLHPTGEMYRRWAEAILPAAQSALRAT